MNRPKKLVVIETHPVQYRAPVYRFLQQFLSIPTTVIYGSDFSVRDGYDSEFKKAFSWDADLLSGYKAVFLPEAGRKIRNISEISTKGLGEALKQLDPGAVLLVGYSPRFHQAAFWQSTRMGIPVLFRGEATDHAVRRNPVKAFFRDLFLKRFYSRCARILYAGRRYHDHFKRFGIPEQKLIFSPYCVDTALFCLDPASRKKFRDQIRSEHQIGEDDVAILFSGKLSRRKGPDLLVEAIRLLPDPIRNRACILFMGDGELWNELKRLAEQSPAVKTDFIGFKNQTEISAYYCAADLLVLPSRHSETWGLVVNEALHHGVPCVVSNAVGCAPDLIESGVTGERFETGSAAGLTEAIIRAMGLIQNPDTARQCRFRADQYSMPRAAEGIARAYHEVVS